VLLGLCTACASSSGRQPSQVHGVVEGVSADAWQLLRNGHPIAALRAARAVDRLLPERGLEAALRRELPPETLARAERPGAWRGAREPLARPLWERAALWLPDRLLDVCDLVSVELDVGVGLRVDLHATQYLPLAGGSAQGVGLGWHPERSLGLSLFTRSEDWTTFEHTRYLSLNGTRSGLVASGLIDGIPDADEPYYHDLGDRWAIGANAHLLLLGVALDVHPRQFWDLLAGFVGFDPWDDDLASTRPFEPDAQMRLRLEALHEVLIDTRGREEYAAWLTQHAADDALRESDAREPTP